MPELRKEIHPKKKIEEEFRINSDEEPGESYKTDLMSRSEHEVRENEDASLPDSSYSFDEQNTDDEEFHDVDDDFLEREIMELESEEAKEEE